ncbi:small subunit ribosomal protein S4, partial [Candidatus Methanophagaceae archaeon]
MGHPKKLKKKYERPRRPWVLQRIKDERELAEKYGLKNKREIWKAE